jgi:ABC-type amino acid transport substrate-binding protein
LRRSGITAQFLALDDSELLTRLAHGSVDVIAPIAVTAERRKRVRFSAALVSTAAAWFIRRESGRSAGEAPAGGETVATPSSGPLEALLRQRFPELMILPTPDYDAALDSVVRGRAAVAALNLHAGREHARRFPAILCPQSGFHGLQLALAFNRTPSSIGTLALDRAIRTMRSEGALRMLERRLLK